jgi:hypothetical protein
VQFLSWISDNGMITWIRESDSQLGYTLYLAFHTIGMVALVGPSLIIAARALGLAPDLPIKPLAAFRPVMKAGFWITMITGTILFATAPEGYVKNVVFLVKIAALITALFSLRGMVREIFDRYPEPDAQPITSRARTWTIVTMLMWVIGVVAGRLTAYSGVVVLESLKAFGIVCLVVAALACVYTLWNRRQAVQKRSGFPIDIHAAAVKGGE